MKSIKVSKVSLESYNKLYDLGYTVIAVTVTGPQKPKKPVHPLKALRSQETKSITPNKPVAPDTGVCKVQHVAQSVDKLK